MNYTEQLTNLVLTQGSYDEDLKMTILLSPQEINAPFGLQCYITIVIDENETLCSGVDRNGGYFIDPLEEYEAEHIFKSIAPFFTKTNKFIHQSNN